MTRDDCLIAVVPFFVPPIASPLPFPPLVPPPRAAPRAACRAAGRAAGRAVRADCLPRTRSDAYDTTFSVHLQQDDTSRMADRFHLRQVFPYIPIRRKAGISISHHDESRFPPHALHMRHGERGEVAAVCLPPLSHRSVWLLPALPIRRNGPDLCIFREWRISRLSCPITVLFYKHTE